MMKKCPPAAALLVLLLLPAPPASAKENPFSELPADHWAYDALSSLAKDKLVTGPLVQRLQKSQTLTRYEMAELVARAMASADKADTADAARLTKLQTEFADELKTLGLRISSLEKRADNITFGGEVEYTAYRAMDEHSDDNSGRSNQLLFRLDPSITITDHWRASTHIDLITDWAMDFSTSSDLQLIVDRAWVTGSYGAMTYDLGKFPLYTDQGLVFDNMVSGARVTVGHKKFTGAFTAGRYSIGPDGRWSSVLGFAAGGSQLADSLSYDAAASFQGLSLYYAPTGRFNTALGFYRVTNRTGLSENYAGGLYKDTDADIWNIGIGGNLSDRLRFEAGYAWNTQGEISSTYKHAYNLGLFYGNADQHYAGSFTLYGAYRYIAQAAVLAPTYEGAAYGLRGWEIGGQYAIAPNILGTLRYFKGRQVMADEESERLSLTPDGSSIRVSILALHLEAFF